MQDMNELRKLAQEAGDKRAAAGLPRHKSPMEKAEEAPGSLRAAVNAMCYDCQGQGADPSYHWRIGNCEVTGCPLWSHRPYKAQHGKPVPANLA